MPRTVDVVVLGNEGVDPAFVGFSERITLPEDLQGYRELWAHLEGIRPHDYNTWKAMMRLWSAGDWYFRLMFVLTAGRDTPNPYRGEPHFWHEVHIELARICQFEDLRNGLLVGSRGIGKSTHLTHNDDIGQKLLDPNHASVIFCHTKEAAQKHLNVHKLELETNSLLKELWSDRFYWDPQKESSDWGLSCGLSIKRSSSRQETSFAAHAFALKLPVGIHPDKRYYDDFEVEEFVRSDEAIAHIEAQYVASQNLASAMRGKAHTGTYYHPAGPLRRLEKEFGMHVFLFPCEDVNDQPENRDEAGPMGGRPINGYTRDECFQIIDDKGGVSNPRAKRDYGMQNLCDPLAGESVRLNVAWIQTYQEDIMEIARCSSIYICQDPSPGMNDPTFTWVWALHPNQNYYWIDGWRKRVTPGKRLAETYFTIMRWQLNGDLKQIRIESFGQGDYCEAQRDYNHQNGIFTKIVKCADPKLSKREREFERWEPPLREGRIYFPDRMMREDQDGNMIDLVEVVKTDELSEWPKPRSDHGMDAGGLLWAREKLVGSLEWPSGERYTVTEDQMIEPTDVDFMAAGIY